MMTRSLSQKEVDRTAKALDGEQQAGWDALDASRRLLFGDAPDIETIPPEARAWAERAMVGFGQPHRRRIATLGRWTARYAREFLFDPTRRRHFLWQMRRPRPLSLSAKCSNPNRV